MPGVFLYSGLANLGGLRYGNRKHARGKDPAIATGCQCRPTGRPGFSHLPTPHKDPFDRLLVRQAQCGGFLLITDDQKLLAVPVRYRAYDSNGGQGAERGCAQGFPSLGNFHLQQTLINSQSMLFGKNEESRRPLAIESLFFCQLLDKKGVYCVQIVGERSARGGQVVVPGQHFVHDGVFVQP